MELSGTYAPILTPFSQDGRAINLTAFRQHLAFLNNAGLSGVVVLGTNGEFGYLSSEERLQLVESVIAAETTLRVIVGGTIADSPEDTLVLVAQLAEYSDRLTAILVAPPFYNTYSSAGKVSEAAVVDFYRRLAGVQSRLPLVLYNVPVPPGGRVTAPVIPNMVRALRGEENIVGVKDSTARLENITAYQEAHQDIQVLVGSDHVIAGGLALGAVGSITACGNVFPSAVLQVYAAQPGVERDKAQAELSLLRGVLESVPGKAIAIQKLLLELLGVVEAASPVRDAAKQLTDVEKESILTVLSGLTTKLTLNQEIAIHIQTQLRG